MTTITRENDLIRRLEAQRFRWERKPDGTGITVKAPEDADLTLLTNPTGIVQIHTQSLRGEKHKFIAIEGELKKIGFVPSWDPQPVIEPVKDPLDGVTLYQRRTDFGDDPDELLITISEAAEMLNITESGVGQRVKAGKLKVFDLPPIPSAPGVRKWFRLGDVKAQPPKGSQGGRRIQTGEPKAGAVKSSYQNTPAGRIHEAMARFVKLSVRIADLEKERQDALDVIGQEAEAMLTETQEAKKRLKDIEGWMAKGISKL